MKAINILGSDWTIAARKQEDDPRLESCFGYTDFTIKSIVTEQFEPTPESVKDLNILGKKVLRHEIVHAFLYESGLAANSKPSDSWALNEEMVDWIAFQGPKIYKAWQDADAL